MIRNLLDGLFSGDGEDSDTDDNRGLFCMYCAEDGFEDQEGLEEHLDGHPFLERREE